jgi:hypothetical protein
MDGLPRGWNDSHLSSWAGSSPSATPFLPDLPWRSARLKPRDWCPGPLLCQVDGWLRRAQLRGTGTAEFRAQPADVPWAVGQHALPGASWSFIWGPHAPVILREPAQGTSSSPRRPVAPFRRPHRLEAHQGRQPRAECQPRSSQGERRAACSPMLLRCRVNPDGLSERHTPLALSGAGRPRLQRAGHQGR